MKLSQNTVYRVYNGQAYVYQLITGRSYLMNGMAFDVLETVRKYGDLSLDGLCGHLLEKYEAKDYPSFYSDICGFVRTLCDEKIIEGVDVCPRNESLVNLPEQVIDEICMKKHILQRVCIELTYRCNERCLHCYVRDEDKTSQREITYEQYVSLMDELKEMGTLHLTFTGGDVSLRDDFLQIMEYATRAKFAVSIYTNGIGFTEEDIDKIVQLHPRSVSFSIYSGIPEEHDKITCVNGSFRRTLYVLMRLKCAGILVSIKNTAMKATQEGFSALVKLARQLDVGLETSYLVCATNHGCAAPARLRIGDVGKYKDMMRTALVGDVPEIPAKRELDGSICGAGGLSLSINPFGDVFPCNGYYVRIGNILEDSIKSIWESDKLKEIRSVKFRDLDAGCLDCVYKDDCSYCVGAALAENGTIYVPVPDTCLIAQAAYELRQGMSDEIGD